MRPVLNLLAIVAAVIAFLLFCVICWQLGRTGIWSPLKLWAVLLSVLAIICGGIGYFTDRSEPRDIMAASNFGIGLGLSGLLTLLILTIFF